MPRIYDKNMTLLPSPASHGGLSFCSAKGVFPEHIASVSPDSLTSPFSLPLEIGANRRENRVKTAVFRPKSTRFPDESGSFSEKNWIFFRMNPDIFPKESPHISKKMSTLLEK